MPNTLKIKRGTNATIPQGQLAEPLFTTDTYDLYIGKGAGGNQRIQNYIASGTSSQFLKGDGSLDSTTYQATSEKGQNNGYASLDAGGKIPAAQLPSSVIEYKGTWNASTNTPTLADGTGDAGDVYIVSVGGTQNLGSGSITFDAGDWVMYNGSIWQKSTGSNAVASVNGQTGIVVLTTTNINEGTNLYFTNSRARTAISLTTTGTSGAATYDNTTGVLNIPQYQSVLTNPITGTGTTNTLPKFTGATTLGNSNVTDSGTLITLGSNSYVNGALGIGTTSLTGYNLRVSKNLTGSTSTTGIQSAGAIQSDVTSDAQYFSSGASTAAASFTVTDLAHFIANQGTFGAGSTVTKQYGFRVAASLTGATNNYAFFSDIASGTNRWNLYMNGTANNYMAGRLGIGNTSLTQYGFRNSLNITGAGNSTANYSDGAIQSDVTGVAAYYETFANTAAAAFTNAALYHYRARQSTIGAGSSVTNQYGFSAESSLTGATNNFGFYGNLAAATGVWNLYMNGTANNYMAGSLGIGSTSLSIFGLRLSKTITGGTIAYGQFADGAIQSDVTSEAMYYSTNATTAASAFTLTNLFHFRARYNTFGATSAVTNQYGFYVDSALTAATNNFGFYGNIAAGTNRWNLYMNGTAANYLAGSLNIGTTSVLSDYPLNVQGTVNGNLLMRFANTSSGTSARLGLILNTDFGTLGSLDAYGTAYNIGSTDDIANGVRLFASGAGGLSLRASNASGTIRFYNGSTESARFGTNGALGIGTTSLTGYSLRANKALTGNADVYGIANTCQANSDATSTVRSFFSQISTQAASYTLSSLMHYWAEQATIGAGSTVTSQFGFYAHSSLTGATNNYGFYGNIASGTNRWNLYMNGTAANYLAGNLGVGATNADVFSRGDSRILGISGSANAAVAINATTGNTAFLQLGVNNTRTFQIQSNATESYIGTGTSTPLIFTIGFNERVRIDTSGNVIIGNGDTSATPASGLIRGTNGSGTNIAGGEFRIQGGISTGNAAGGSITFYTAAGGLTGSSLNTAALAMTINSFTDVIFQRTISNVSTGGDDIIHGNWNSTGGNVFTTSISSSNYNSAGDSTTGYGFLAKDTGGTVRKIATIVAQVTTRGATSLAGDLVFATSNSGANPTEKLRITAAGAATFSADVNTSGRFKGRVGGSGVAFETTNAVDADFTIETVAGGTTKIGTSGNKLAINSGGGNVGIGTTIPSGIVNGGGLVIYNSLYPRLILQNSTTGTSTNAYSGAYMVGSDMYVENPLGNTNLRASHASGNLIFATAGTERMRITSGGNVGIGTTSPFSANGINLEVANSTIARLVLNQTGTRKFSIGAGDNILNIYDETAGAERMRITSGGYLKASNDGTYQGATDNYHEISATAASNDALAMRHKSATQPFGMSILFSGTTPNNQNNYFFHALDTTNSKAYIWSDGTFVSRTGTYTNFSDINIKQDIVDAKSQWDDIKNLKVKNYRLKDEVASDPNYPYHIGVIAQELETICPNLVSEMPNYKLIDGKKEIDGNIKIVKYSILYMKAVKALQEAMERVETLETEMSTIKAKLN